jgi:hypothetical protein
VCLRGAAAAQGCRAASARCARWQGGPNAGPREI